MVLSRRRVYTPPSLSPSFFLTSFLPLLCVSPFSFHFPNSALPAEFFDPERMSGPMKLGDNMEAQYSTQNGEGKKAVLSDTSKVKGAAY